MKNCVMIAVMIAAGICGSAMGALVEVGSGSNFANVTINWSDGYAAEFKVFFESSTISGLDALNAIDLGLDNFGLTLTNHSFGVSVDGISYTDPLSNVHFNPGYISGDNWWHYWTKEAGEISWTSSWIGASDRVLSNGDSDGWVYGNDGAPIPEPMTGLLLTLGVGLLKIRRK